MAKLMKWRKTMYMVLALGVVELAVYGVLHTVTAFKGISQAQAAAYTSNTDDAGTGLTPGGTLCSYYGCAGCSGCAYRQYQQTIETAPGSTVSTDEF
jgi:hypothetical protein